MPITSTSTLGGGSSLIKVGQYTGDGNATQAIIGVGFQPKGLMIYRADDTPGFSPIFKITEDLLVCSFFVGTAGGHWGFVFDDDVISLDADGFTVGDGTTWNPVANINLVVYRYIAWG